jgi:hypothetical protein
MSDFGTRLADGVGRAVPVLRPTQVKGCCKAEVDRRSRSLFFIWSARQQQRQTVKVSSVISEMVECGRTASGMVQVFPRGKLHGTLDLRGFGDCRCDRGKEPGVLEEPTFGVIMITACLDRH